MREFLKCYPKSILFNVLLTHKLKTIFPQEKTNYNITMVLQCKILQHNSGGITILVANTISYTGKFAKKVHPDFFGENGGRSPHQSDLENY